MAGIIMGALAGLGKGMADVADSNTRLWNQQDLEKQRADLETKKAMALEDYRNTNAIAAEQRGLANRATERQSITDETIKNAPALRVVAAENAKSLKMVEYDPEIQALMRKAETEKLTAKEQAELDFFKKNENSIVGKERAMARAKDIDHGAGLRGIQTEIAKLSLDEKKAEMKMPPAVKEQANAYREQIKAKTAIIDKAVAEGTSSPEGLKALEAQRDSLSAKVEGLYRPYLGDKAGKEPDAGAPTAKPSPPEGTRGSINGVKGTIRNGVFVPDGTKPAATESAKPTTEEKPKARAPSTIPGAPDPNAGDESNFTKLLNSGSGPDSPEYAQYLKKKIRLNQPLTSSEKATAQALKLL